MSSRNNRIILASGINVTRDYTHVLNLDQAGMISLCAGNSVYDSSDYEFIRSDENTVQVQCDYNTALSDNYICIIDQSFTTKAIFGFIDSVKYISDGCCRIKFEWDQFHTWHYLITRNSVFVDRQHPQSDDKFANLQPEPFTGDLYKTIGAVNINVNPTQFVALFSERWTGSGFAPPDPESSAFGFIDNLPHTMYEYIDNIDAANYNLSLFAVYYQHYIENGKAADLLGMYLRPTPHESAYTFGEHADLDGYVPKNKKMYNSPFCLYKLSNNSGQNLSLKPELCGNTLTVKWKCADCGKAQSFLYPGEYAGRTDNYDFGLLIDNYMTVPMAVDSYAAWMGQSSAGAAANIALSGGLGLIGAVTGNPMAMAGAAMGAISEIGSMFLKPDNMADTVVGRSGGAVINQAMQLYMFTVEYQTIKADVAKRIDDYFTVYGYAQNTIQQVYTSNPRFPWHFVKIGSREIIGKSNRVPKNAFDAINNAYRSGVTFWQSNDIIGNYTT